MVIVAVFGNSRTTNLKGTTNSAGKILFHIVGKLSGGIRFYKDSTRNAPLLKLSPIPKSGSVVDIPLVLPTSPTTLSLLKGNNTVLVAGRVTPGYQPRVYIDSILVPATGIVAFPNGTFCFRSEILKSGKHTVQVAQVNSQGLESPAKTAGSYTIIPAPTVLTVAATGFLATVVGNGNAGAVVKVCMPFFISFGAKMSILIC